MTAGFSLRGLFIAVAIVALGLPVAFLGLYHVVDDINRLNGKIATVREAQLRADDVVRLQIEQETSVRGYAATQDAAFKETYRNASRELPLRVADVADRLIFGGDDARAAAALADAIAVNHSWEDAVAKRVLANAPAQIDDRQANRKLARFRADLDRVSAVLIADYHRLIREHVEAANQSSLIGYGAFVVVALQVLVYAFLANRLRAELARERRVVSVLQQAFTSEILMDPRLDVSATYVSATRGAKVGGDVYDVFPLAGDTTLIVIADVSGKGVEAAVDSTFVKYSLRAFASDHTDIATVLTKFNALYRRAQKSAEAFVVVFAGILDHRTATLTYVNAGHEAAYVRRRESIEQLAPTGPLIGIADDLAFLAAATLVSSDDLLFLSTDGLTEARDPSGIFLTSRGVETWLRETGDAGPRDVIDRIARRLRQYTRARSADDLAILAVRPRHD